eukprot:COSAG05_NODE_608_length_8372_cov_2.996615_6_plen_63_part_00
MGRNKSLYHTVGTVDSLGKSWVGWLWGRMELPAVAVLLPASVSHARSTYDARGINRRCMTEI